MYNGEALSSGVHSRQTIPILMAGEQFLDWSVCQKGGGILTDMLTAA